MAIINLLPYAVTILNEKGLVHHTFEGMYDDWCTTGVTVDGTATIEGFPLMGLEIGDTSNLPEFKGGDYDYYIVSHWTLAAHPERPDLLSPCESVEDLKGQHIGYRGLTRNPLVAGR